MASVRKWKVVRLQGVQVREGASETSRRTGFLQCGAVVQELERKQNGHYLRFESLGEGGAYCGWVTVSSMKKGDPLVKLSKSGRELGFFESSSESEEVAPKKKKLSKWGSSSVWQKVGDVKCVAKLSEMSRDHTRSAGPPTQRCPRWLLTRADSSTVVALQFACQDFSMLDPDLYEDTVIRFFWETEAFVPNAVLPAGLLQAKQSNSFFMPVSVRAGVDSFYICDAAAHIVFRGNLHTLETVQFAGTGRVGKGVAGRHAGDSFALNSPMDAVEHDGEVFIADHGNKRVVAVLLAGATRIVASRLQGPVRLAARGSQLSILEIAGDSTRLLVVDTASSWVTREEELDNAPMAHVIWCSDYLTGMPVDICHVVSADALYVLHSAGGFERKDGERFFCWSRTSGSAQVSSDESQFPTLSAVDLCSQSVEHFSILGGNLIQPTSMCYVAESRRLVVVDRDALVGVDVITFHIAWILKHAFLIPGSGGRYSETYFPDVHASYLCRARGLAFFEDGFVLVADAGNKRVLYFTIPDSCLRFTRQVVVRINTLIFSRLTNAQLTVSE